MEANAPIIFIFCIALSASIVSGILAHNLVLAWVVRGTDPSFALKFYDAFMGTTWLRVLLFLGGPLIICLILARAIAYHDFHGLMWPSWRARDEAAELQNAALREQSMSSRSMSRL